MMWILFSILLLVSGYLLREIMRIMLAAVPPQVTQLEVGGARASQSHIPKIIWAYWHEDMPPDFVTLCCKNWQRKAPDHQVRFITPSGLHKWLHSEVLSEGFNTLPPFRQADWLRLELLKTHGGIWLDASIILTENLAWVHAYQQTGPSEYMGFYLDRYSTDLQRPVIENWFMAAVPGSAFITDLAGEFNRAISLGEGRYMEELLNRPESAQILQGIKNPHYLIMHVAGAVLLYEKLADYRLSLLKAEDSALGFQNALGWRKHQLYARLALTPCPANIPRLIKLRGGERKIAQRWYSAKRYLGNSLLAKHLATPASD
jgi:hypothetical protein